MCPEGYNHQAVVDFETNIISIHMPMRGTTNTRSGRRPLPHFNPRAHEGHDLVVVIRTRMCCISIHVPTRGTTEPLIYVAEWRRFQSTCPRGARLTITNIKSWRMNFNPRAHEGHDRRRQAGPRHWWHFNPRAHEGHDVTVNYQSNDADFNPRAHEGHDCITNIFK